MSKIKYAVVGILLIAVVLTTIQAATAYSSNSSQAFSNIEPEDSDNDGYSNFAEIAARTFPGDQNDHPAPAPVLTTITVTPSTATLAINGTQTFTAAAKDQYSNPFTTTFTWSSSNTTVGTVNSTGKFTALSNGTTIINATNGSVSGSASVTVAAIAVPPSPAGTAQVTFLVVNNKTGKPVREAEVTLDGVTKETNRAGQVTFNNVTIGSHTYKVVPEDDDDDDNDTGNHQVNGTNNVTDDTVIQVELTLNEGHAYGHEHNHDDHGHHYGHDHDHSHGLKLGHDHKGELRTADDDDEEDDDS